MDTLPKKILVIGDVMLDKYRFGHASRLSPEAPVPVVNDVLLRYTLGGAANVALNLSSLGADVYICGVVGKDVEGDIVLNALKDKGVNVDGLLTVGYRPTTLKERILVDSQQVVRLDNEVTTPVGKKDLSTIVDFIRSVESDTIIISDYEKGMVSSKLLKGIFPSETMVFVDPKKDLKEYKKNITVLFPNLKEVERLLSRKLSNINSCHDCTPLDDDVCKTNCDKYKERRKAGIDLQKKYKCEAVVVKSGHDGLFLISGDGSFHHCKAKHVSNPSVIGAGDTVISTFGFFASQGISFEYSTQLSNVAGYLSVGKLGTNSITFDEICEEWINGC